MNSTEIIVNYTNGVIDGNFEEVKGYLKAQIEPYTNMVFSDGMEKDAKAILTDLRKGKKGISSKRIEIKKAYMVPYDAFEEKMKELESICDEGIRNVDSWVKASEEKRRAEKHKEIEKIYAKEIPDDLKQILTLDRIYQPKWENATCKAKEIKSDMQEPIVQLKENIRIIKSMNEECEEEALKALYASLALSDAINYINDYKAKKAAILERQKAEEARKAEEEKRAAEPAPIPEPIPEPISEPIPEPVLETVVEEPLPFGDPVEVVENPKKVAIYEVEIADEFDTNTIESLFEEAGLKYRRVK